MRVMAVSKLGNSFIILRPFHPSVATCSLEPASVGKLTVPGQGEKAPYCSSQDCVLVHTGRSAPRRNPEVPARFLSATSYLLWDSTLVIGVAKKEIRNADRPVTANSTYVRTLMIVYRAGGCNLRRLSTESKPTKSAKQASRLTRLSDQQAAGLCHDHTMPLSRLSR